MLFVHWTASLTFTVPCLPDRRAVETATRLNDFGVEWTQFLQTHQDTLQSIEASVPGWQSIDDSHFWELTTQFATLNERLERLQAPCLSVAPEQISSVFTTVSQEMPNLSVLDTRGIRMSQRETTAFARVRTRARRTSPPI